MMAFAVMALCGQIAPVLVAQDSAPAPANPGAAVTASSIEPRPVELSASGASEILKLSRGKVSDEIIATFIKTSGRLYPLSASEVVYLREQGVSDPVVAVMLNKRANGPTPAVQAVPQPARTEQPAAPTYNTSPQPAPTEPPAAASYNPNPPPANAYGAAEPTYVPASTVYVFGSPGYNYYNTYPYYSGPYWGYPAVSFGFGYGGGHYGGYRGGGFHGGGFGGGHSGRGGHR